MSTIPDILINHLLRNPMKFEPDKLKKKPLHHKSRSDFIDHGMKEDYHLETVEMEIVYVKLFNNVTGILNQSIESIVECLRLYQKYRSEFLLKALMSSIRMHQRNCQEIDTVCDILSQIFENGKISRIKELINIEI